MSYVFATGLHACDVGGQLVFLDVEADRYFALADPSNAVCQNLVAGAPMPAATAIIDDLIARRILARAGNGARPTLCAPLTRPHASLLDGTTDVSAARISAALLRHFGALVEIRVRPLSALLAGVGRAKARVGLGSRRCADARRIAAAFSGADRLLSAFGRCLPRSVALARAMFADDLAPDLVIGVKLRPFEAHCWVQHDGLLVSDRLETIQPYTPILVL